MLDTRTPEQVNRGIAERLGWTKIHLDEEWLIDDQRTSARWVGISSGQIGIRWTEPIPDFTHSLDTTLDALPPLYSIGIYSFRSLDGTLLHYNAFVTPYPPLVEVVQGDDAPHDFHGEGATRAAAAAAALALEAWLAGRAVL